MAVFGRDAFKERSMNPADGRTVVNYLRQTLCGAAPTDVSDEGLLGQYVAERDESAFAALLRRHGPMVWGVCQRLLGHRQDAEDAFQATFLVLACKAASIARPKQLANWLFGVARRAALNVRTVRARRASREQSWGDPPDVTAIVETPCDNIGPVLDEELARLPAKYRLPLLLCGLEGMTHAEAGKHLGWPKGTVAGRLSRARELLRTRLLRRGVTAPAALTPVLTASGARATVPPQLLACAGKSAALLAAGKSAAALVSPGITTLMRGVLLKMFLSRLSTTIALMAALAVILASAGATWHLMAPAQTHPFAQESLRGSRSEAAYRVAPVAAAQPGRANVPGKPSLRLPADPNAVVLHMDRSLLSTGDSLFSLTIYANGRVVAEVADDSVSQGNANKHAKDPTGAPDPETQGLKVLEGKLSVQELEELLRFALHDQEFFDFDSAAVKAAIQERYPSQGSMAASTDPSTSVFRIQTADRSHEVRWSGLSKAVGDSPKAERLLQLWAINRRISHVHNVLLAGGRERVEAVVARMNELDLPCYRSYADAPRLTAADLSQVTPSADGSTTQFTFVRMKDKTFFKPLFGVSINVPAQGEPTLRYIIPPQ
jgi:RNA polymerase sigma factor (sigma-70 family)